MSEVYKQTYKVRFWAGDDLRYECLPIKARNEAEAILVALVGLEKRDPLVAGCSSWLTSSKNKVEVSLCEAVA